VAGDTDRAVLVGCWATTDSGNTADAEDWSSRCRCRGDNAVVADRQRPGRHETAVAAAGRRTTAQADQSGRGRPGEVNLTTRERDVLAAIARGRANREIARQFGLSEKTVKTHVSAILTKLGVQDRTQAAPYAVRHGIADP
jgi:DNA-binding NarL/FixJ family response regulator